MRVISIVRFIFYFFKGLERNFKIIRYGDVPDIYNSPSTVERYSFAGAGPLSIFFVIKELFRHCLRARQSYCVVPEDSIIFCGGTENNEREFVFLTHKILKGIPEAVYSRERNLFFLFGEERRKQYFERLLSGVVFLLVIMYLPRVKMGPVTFKYLVSYSKLYLRLFCSFRESCKLPALLVVANDHTDLPVAATMVMRYFRVPVCYVQHAEVSEFFPPLDFYISILRNQKTLDKYQSISKVRGDVYVVPRSEKSQRFERILESRNILTADVVIYLSSIFNINVVRDCAEALLQNPFVATVSIKPHPRSDASVFQKIEGVVVCEQIPNFVHLAIVPNSSVSVELLEQGIPVFQYFALDAIVEDYYGFVADGITLPVQREVLFRRFWCKDFYNASWIERFKKYSPSLDDDWQASIDALVEKVELTLSRH